MLAVSLFGVAELSRQAVPSACTWDTLVLLAAVFLAHRSGVGKNRLMCCLVILLGILMHTMGCDRTMCCAVVGFPTGKCGLVPSAPR